MTNAVDFGSSQSPTEHCTYNNMAASSTTNTKNTATANVSSKGNWPDHVVSLLLEAVRKRESIWNTKSEEYKNRNIKKAQYEQVLQIIKDELPNVDLVSLKGMYQFVI